MKRSDLQVGMEVVVTNAYHTNKPGFRNGDVLVCIKVGDSSLICRNKLTGESEEMLAWEVSPIGPQNPVTMNNTPATRMGIQVGDHVVSHNSGRHYTLVSDNGGNHPLFKDVHNGAETNIYINDITKVEALCLRTPAQKAGIEVGDYVRGNWFRHYYLVTALKGGSRVEVLDLHINKPGTCDVSNVSKVTEQEAKAATTPSALRGWKVGDYFEITDGSFGKVGDVIKMVRDSGTRGDNWYINVITGEEHHKDHSYVRKLSVAEAEAKIAELKKTTMERAGFMIGEKVVYNNTLLTILGVKGKFVSLVCEKNLRKYLTLDDIQKYDGDYCKLIGLNPGDIVISKGSSSMQDECIGVLEGKVNRAGRVAKWGYHCVPVKDSCSNTVYLAIEHLRKATKAEVIQYLKDATGTVSADIVKFALE